MKRRTFIIGATGTGAVLAVGTGAFSFVRADRELTVEVVGDADAYLGLDQCHDSANATYATHEGGQLVVDVSDNDAGGEGVNPNALTRFHGVFQLCNNGTQDVCVWIERDDDWPATADGDPRVDFYIDDDPAESILGEENARSLEVGACHCVGIEVDTIGLDADVESLMADLGDEMTIVADVDCPDPEGPGEPESPVDPGTRTWSDTDEDVVSGGRVILMGLDSELGAGSDGHGPPADHASMVASLLEDVPDDREGILVLGGDSGNVVNYWEGDIGSDPSIDEPVTFVSSVDDILDADFDGYAMIGVASSTFQLPGSVGLTDPENQAIADRAGDIAQFVNDGGALLGKTQEDLSDPWAYVDPFGEFENRELGWDQYQIIEVTDEGNDLGLTQDGMSGWCCYHETFPAFPDFFDVLIYNRDSGNPGEDEAAAIGGGEVIIERAVSLELAGPANVEVDDTQTYDVTVSNDGDEPIEGTFEVELDGDGSIGDTLPASISVDPDDEETWTEAIELTPDGAGTLELTVRVESGGETVLELTAEIDGVPNPPGVA